MSIIKKIALATAIAAISGGVAMANGGTYVQPQSNHSIFVGIGGSYSNIEMNHHHSFGQTSTSLFNFLQLPQLPTSAQYSNRVNKLSPTIQAGFLYSVNPNFFLGLEGVDTYLDASNTTQILFGDQLPGSVKTKMNNLLSVLLLAGTHLNQDNTVTFGVGPAFASVKDSLYASQGTVTDTLGNPENIYSATGNQSKTLTGITAQIGWQHYFTPNWFLDATYSYSAFGRKTFQSRAFQNVSGIDEVPGQQVITTASDGVRLTAQQLTLTLNRSFM